MLKKCFLAKIDVEIESSSRFFIFAFSEEMQLFLGSVSMWIQFFQERCKTNFKIIGWNRMRTTFPYFYFNYFTFQWSHSLRTFDFGFKNCPGEYSPALELQTNTEKPLSNAKIWDCIIEWSPSSLVSLYWLMSTYQTLSQQKIFNNYISALAFIVHRSEWGQPHKLTLFKCLSK